MSNPHKYKRSNLIAGRAAPHYTVAIKSKALPTQRTKWRYNSAAPNQAHTIEL